MTVSLREVTVVDVGATSKPRLRISILSELAHFYMAPVMRLRGKIANVAELPMLPPEDSAPELLERFDKMWSAQKAHATGDGSTLRAVIFRLLSPRFPLIALWQLVDAAANFSTPVIIAALVGDIRMQRWDRLGYDFLLVVLLGLASLIAASAIQQVLWNGARVGMRAKIALSAATYTKTLKLGNAALLSTSAGQATNLVAIDVNRLELSYTFFHMLWYCPFCVIVLGVVLGVFLVGVAALPGLAFLVVIFLLQKVVGGRIARLRQRIVKETDARVKLMHDVLAGCEALKVNAWEDALASRVRSLRVVEERLIWRSLCLLSTIEALIFFAPGVATFLVLVTRHYLPEGQANPLQIEEAYAVLGFVNVLVKQFNVFPRAVKSFDESRVSFRRVERFLLLPDARDGSEEPVTAVAAAAAAAAAAGAAAAATGEQPAPVAAPMVGNYDALVLVEKASASWAAAPSPTKSMAAGGGGNASDGANGGGKGGGGDDAEAPFALRDIEVSLRRGELCLVAGEVGSGKSSLLQMLLGEMVRLPGSGPMRIERAGGVGYVPQTPWIVNATVRENITLGRVADGDEKGEWYAQVIECCALTTDLESLESGDLTEIGERGVTVSGGQKARISFARALYGKPALLLLDDPLSAVDQHVARHLVNEALLRVAKKELGSAVVLASHQLQFAQELAEVAIVLEHGNVLGMGAVAALAEKGLLPQQSAAAPAADAKHDTTEPAKDDASADKEATLAAASSAPATPPAAVTAAAAAAAAAPAPAKAMSKVEMGTDNQKGEAARFYLEMMGTGGVLAISLTFLGLAATRAMADWALGRWILSPFSTARVLLYSLLIAGTVALGVAYALAFTGVIGAASRIHHAVLRRVLRAPKSFFDTTPLGMVLNVFSKDMDTLDELLPISLTGLAKCITIVSTALVVSAIAAPVALAIIPLVFVVFRRLTRYFQRTATQLKRLDKATSGPLFSLYSETLLGVTSIRAFGLEPQFRKLLLLRLDQNHAAHFLWTASNRWFAARLDWLTALVILCVGLSVLLFRELLEPGVAALALTYAMQITSMFQWGFRNYAEVRNHFVSVERALSYTKLAQEAAEVVESVDAPLRSSSWPAAGEIRFADVQLRYRPGLPVVLSSVDFTIAAGVKAAVVGRSGAGKSSLSVALLRLAPLDAGTISIDGVDISTLGTRLLRRAITFIQQDAILFSGSLRSNLDPFGEHPDEALKAALERVDFARLSGYKEDAVLGLDVAEGGGNLSAGTRQIIMLARAMLRQTKILLMDEATANCDLATDAVIQRVVRTQFAAATVLTIAHRISTIIDYDLILLMAAGEVAESGPPSELLGRGESLFSQLVAKAGDAAMSELRAAADEAVARKGATKAAD